jgi:hypothetical protein
MESDPEAQASILMLQMRLFNAVVLRDFAVAEKTYDTLTQRKQKRINGSHFINQMIAFSEGLLFAELNRQKRTRRSRKILKENIAWLKARTKARNVNCVGLLQVLLAEESTSRSEIRLNMYDIAIKTLVRSGFCHFGAMANEAAARYSMKESGSNDVSTRYLLDAAELYAQWGASRKVEALLNEYQWLRPLYRGERISVSVKGRERFDSNRDDVTSFRASTEIRISSGPKSNNSEMLVSSELISSKSN